MSTDCMFRNSFMEDRQFFQCGSSSPTCKVRRRTSSDATWRARRRTLDADWNAENAGCRGRTTVDVRQDQMSDVFRTNTADNKMAAAAGRQQPQPMSSGPCSINNEPSMMTMTSQNYSRPSPSAVAAAKVAPIGDQLARVEQTTRDVINAHLITSVHTADSVKRGILMCRAMSTIHGPCDMRKLQQPQQQQHGPADPKKLWTTFSNNMAPTIKRVSVFSSLLPGFSELGVEDQDSLFKQGSFEVILARYARCFTNDGMLTPDMTMIIPRHLIHRMPLGELFLEQYDFADIFNRINLTDSELGLVGAVMLTNPERIGLIYGTAIANLQVHYLQCLYVYLKKHHTDDHDELFEKILDVLPLCSAVNESHAKKINAVKAAAAAAAAAASMTCDSVGSDNNNGDAAALSFPEIHNVVYP